MQAVLKQVTGAEIKKMVFELSTQLAAKLEAGKSVAMGIILTLNGLEIVEVSINDKDDDLINIISAKNGVLRYISTGEEPVTFTVPEAAAKESGIIPHQREY